MRKCFSEMTAMKCCFLLGLLVCIFGTIAPATNAQNSTQEVAKLDEALIQSFVDSQLTQEQASALYASYYVREDIPFANRTIFRLNVDPVAKIAVDLLPKPVESGSLPPKWQQLWSSYAESDPIDKDQLQVDLRWSKVQDRDQLAKRINRNAPLYQSKHFYIEADVPGGSIPEIVLECELTYSLLHKLFDLGEVQKPLWVRVVRNRAAYVKLLRREVQQIGLTNGYFDIASNSVICYWDKSGDTITSLRHELTHLVLTNGWTETQIDWSQQNHFWAFEAIATYIESAITRAGVGEVCCMIGGWESPRLQPARYRRLHDQQWIAFEDLIALERERFQDPQDIQLRYSQSAGLAHYFMDSDKENRDRFINYVISVHRGEPKLELLGIGSDEELRKRYDRFLLSAGKSVKMHALQPAREDIVLSRVPIMSTDLLGWPPSHRKLDWLDLSFTNNDGQWLMAQPAWDVQRLNIESTNIDDSHMKAIASMSNLRELDLSNCNVSDRGVEQLVDLQRLETLWLSGTKVTNDAAPLINGMKPLRSVHLDGVNVDRSLFKRLP